MHRRDQQRFSLPTPDPGQLREMLLQTSQMKICPDCPCSAQSGRFVDSRWNHKVMARKGTGRACRKVQPFMLRDVRVWLSALGKEFPCAGSSRAHGVPTQSWGHQHVQNPLRAHSCFWKDQEEQERGWEPFCASWMHLRSNIIPLSRMHLLAILITRSFPLLGALLFLLTPMLQYAR